MNFIVVLIFIVSIVGCGGTDNVPQQDSGMLASDTGMTPGDRPTNPSDTPQLPDGMNVPETPSVGAPGMPPGMPYVRITLACERRLRSGMWIISGEGLDPRGEQTSIVGNDPGPAMFFLVSMPSIYLPTGVSSRMYCSINQQPDIEGKVGLVTACWTGFDNPGAPVRARFVLDDTCEEGRIQHWPQGQDPMNRGRMSRLIAALRLTQ